MSEHQEDYGNLWMNRSGSFLREVLLWKFHHFNEEKSGFTSRVQKTFAKNFEHSEGVKWLKHALLNVHYHQFPWESGDDFKRF